MNFDEQLNAIKNFGKDDLLVNHDFMLDYEHLHLERCVGTGYRHKRLTGFSDDELVRLADAYHCKVFELF